MTEVAHADARVGTLVAVSVAIRLRGFLGGDVPVRVEAYDGSVLGPVGACTVLRVRSADAIRRVLTRPGELGIARAYVAGDLDIDRGTIFDVLELRHTRTDLRLRPADLLAAARAAAILPVRRPRRMSRSGRSGLAHGCVTELISLPVRAGC